MLCVLVKLPVSYVLTGNLLTGKLPATNITGTLRTLILILTLTVNYDPVTLTFEQVVFRTHIQTDTHSGPIAVPGPLTWSVRSGW